MASSAIPRPVSKLVRKLFGAIFWQWGGVFSSPTFILCKIADFDVRRVIEETRDVERYLGIQRPLNKDRVEDLKRYVRYYDASFPTSVIIAVDQECVAYDSDKQQMTLSNVIEQDDAEKKILFRQIARVLDGQHRIAGLFGYEGPEFDLTVTIFVGIDIADQAHIFSTVNLEQTKVSRSLTYDLFALARSRSPQKTCHNIAVALDREDSSPFYRRIKRLGVAGPGRPKEAITQAAFVEALIKYITSDPRSDRDVLLRGKKLPPPKASELQKHPLRGLFIADKDELIADLVLNYFDAVRTRWPNAWASGGQGLILNKTNGFRALMRLFKPAYLYWTAPGGMVDKEKFLRLFKASSLSDDDFNTNNFKPGSSGESELVRRLARELQLEV